MINGLVGSLKLPIAWINEAKVRKFDDCSTITIYLYEQALYAFDHGDVYEAYEWYLTAGLYNEAHHLAVLELAPDAVIRQDLSLLKDLFGRFEGHPVEDWHVGGKVIAICSSGPSALIVFAGVSRVCERLSSHAATAQRAQ